ncbi:FG-GAP repeat domain-containing protein [Polyangium jinanense]|uniref:VCBS repeat-containing protein n=1 Tax=Polyangium jinanense TaxID=2829994 RepID=A0A9X3X8Z6_9BACT|nr:VCBS repeat-containing protein [Polyangium jinanense]MDC3958105.1 VCBS repeat-containing protein [Polyangium jinanense]MDC3983696.1 VCBS repeat-containing protein [Polyangium jinanense]
MPPLTAFAAPPDIEVKLSAIDEETRALGLQKTSEIRAKLPRGGGDVVVRGYESVDILGRKIFAVRAATVHGVVLAVGPRDAADHATELVAALVPGASGGYEDGAFRALTDLNGDGTLDVVLRGSGGTLEVHRIFPTGSAQYDVEMTLAPTEVADVDEDGHLDLVGRVSMPQDDPIRPAFVEVATFEAGRYRARSEAAIAFHTRRADAPLRTPKEKDAPVDDVTRVRRALEQAWHAIHAGRARGAIMEALEKEPVPASLRASFDAHVARIRSALSAQR